eukprot:7576937-Pyramimonas_sp.AAC.1
MRRMSEDAEQGAASLARLVAVQGGHRHLPGRLDTADDVPVEHRAADLTRHALDDALGAVLLPDETEDAVLQLHLDRPEVMLDAVVALVLSDRLLRVGLLVTSQQHTPIPIGGSERAMGARCRIGVLARTGAFPR